MASSWRAVRVVVVASRVEAEEEAVSGACLGVLFDERVGGWLGAGAWGGWVGGWVGGFRAYHGSLVLNEKLGGRAYVLLLWSIACCFGYCLRSPTRRV